MRLLGIVAASYEAIHCRTRPKTHPGLCALTAHDSCRRPIKTIVARQTIWTSAGPAWMRPAWPAPGDQYTGPNPTDRGKLGSKRHIITDRQGVPLIFCVTGANRHDSVVFEQLVDALPTARRLSRSARRWPHKLHADKGYDFARCCAYLASWASRRVLPGAASSAMTGSGVIAGWSSARMPG